MTTPHFKITGSTSGLSLSSAGGHSAVNGETLTFELEDSPALDVVACTYLVVTSSKGSSALTLSNGGIASPPTAGVTTTVPSGVCSYMIRCQVVTAAGVFTHERIFSVLTSGGLRKNVPAERTEYDLIYGWVASQNDMVDAVAGAVASVTSPWKVQATYVSTTNLSLSGGATVDGFAVANGDVVLAAGQTTPAQNGPYLVNTAGAWTRTTDADIGAEVTEGLTIKVSRGTAFADSYWTISSDGAITLGTTPITVTQVIFATSVNPDPNTVAKRDGSGGLKAAYLDSGAASDLLLKRNSVTIATIGAAAITLATGVALLGATTLQLESQSGLAQILANSGAVRFGSNQATPTFEWLGSGFANIRTDVMPHAGAVTQTWAAGISSVTESFSTKTSDALPAFRKVQSQAPFASATGANRTPGSVILSVPAASGGGTEGKISFEIGAAEVAYWTFATEQPLSLNVDKTKGFKLLVEQATTGGGKTALFEAGKANATGTRAAGGNISVQAGAGAGDSGSGAAGGVATIAGGSGSDSGGVGGVAQVIGGSGGSGNGNGGKTIIASGPKNGSGVHGVLELRVGGAAGAVQFQADTTGIGFYGGATAAQPADMGALTDNTTGTADGTVADVGAAFNQATLNNNFADLIAKINALRTAQRNLGLMA